ncbi:hypothetical protein ACIQMV_29310 [Streptomyces sp. NPDC091412]|uniref:LppU/SCO3897 family protein n=1 Tax=Streptomyces sp. NPDC091412 TaxID=3366002 RepID=UPI0038114E71
MSTPPPFQDATDTPPAQPGYGPFCRFCGSMPAVEATFRGHQGFLVIMRFLKLQGPFCRTCGIATHRRMTANSLWQGWWGIASVVINPITMLINLPQRAKVSKLGDPIPGAPGQPMDPGKPLFQRAAILGFLIPVVAIGAVAFQAQRDPSLAAVGDCVRNQHVTTGSEDTDPDVVVVPCSDPAAEAKIIAREAGTSDSEATCRKYVDADGYFIRKGSNPYTLCLHFLK